MKLVMNKKIDLHITSPKHTACIKNDKPFPISQFFHKTDTIHDDN